MRVAVLANEDSKKELMKKMNLGAQTPFWTRSLEDFAAYDADLYFDLDFAYDAGRIGVISQLLPRPVFINSIVHTLVEIGQPFIRINAWPGFLGGSLAELALMNKEEEQRIAPFFESLNWKYKIVPDIPGMISPRIIAMIINEAYYTFQEQISSQSDIDLAMKLGTGYPLGPFEWGRQIGLQHVCELLRAMRDLDKRYTLSETLEKEAMEIG